MTHKKSKNKKNTVALKKANENLNFSEDPSVSADLGPGWILEPDESEDVSIAGRDNKPFGSQLRAHK
jgi:hypothetical protein